jgi:hypothetical protein
MNSCLDLLVCSNGLRICFCDSRMLLFFYYCDSVK